MSRLVIVCGLPGVGKSTVAERVAERLGAEHLRTDAVRKEIRSTPRYDADESRRVYAALVDMARERLEAGEDVVLDGTYGTAKHREWARSVAAELDAAFAVLRVECEEAVATERIATREGDVSDATPETFYEIRAGFDAPESDAVIDNSGDRAATARQLDAWASEFASKTGR